MRLLQRRRGRRRGAAVPAGVAAAALLLTGCGGGATPTVDPGDEPPAAGSADGSDGAVGADGADGSDGSDVELPECPDFDDPRSYSPPPEDQPATDPAITSPELFPDIAITDGVDPDDIPDGAQEHGMEVFGAAREWAEAEAPDHFAGMWIDGEHGAAVIAFTDDLERYATEVRERFGSGWWVVEAEHSEAELARLQEAVSDDASWGGLEDARTPPGSVVSTSRLDDRQKVEIMVVGGDDAVLRDLADRFDHPAYCFVVLDPPPTYDGEGEVRTLATAAGWRDGLSQETADSVLEVAYEADAAERAFADNVPDDHPTGDGDPWEDALHAGLDTVDWDREAVVVWSSGRSGSCPSWVEDLRTVDGAVAVETASPVRGACTDDWNPYRTVLAVDLDRLPPVEDLPVPVEEGWSGGGRAVPYPAD